MRKVALAVIGLVLSVGIANFQAQRPVLATKTAQERVYKIRQLQGLDPRPPRDGGLVH